MAFLDRKRKWSSAFISVATAPFYLLAVGVLANLIWLILAAGLYVLSVNLTGEKFGSFLPDRETIFIGIGCIVFIGLASVPLVLRDHFKNGGYERVWIPTPKCIETTTNYISMLIRGETDELYSRFSPKLKSMISADRFSQDVSDLEKFLGPHESIHSICEAELPTGNPFSDYEYDCVVRAELNHRGTKTSSLALFLDSKAGYCIVGYEMPDSHQLERLTKILDSL